MFIFIQIVLLLISSTSCVNNVDVKRDISSIDQFLKTGVSQVTAFIESSIYENVIGICEFKCENGGMFEETKLNDDL